MKEQMDKMRIAQIQNLVDEIVEKEGFPVFGHMLVRHNIATRSELRKLVSDRYLIEYPVVTKGTIQNCYYTPGKVPVKVAEYEEQKRQYEAALKAAIDKAMEDRFASEDAKELETTEAG